MARKHKTVTCGSLEFSAPTIREAKEMRDTHLAKLVEEMGTPVAVAGPEGIVGLVYRGVYNWEYVLQRPTGDHPNKFRDCGMSCGMESKQEALVQLRRLFAQNAYGVEADDGFSYLEGDPQGQEEHERWVLWQKRYARLTNEEGLSDYEARERLLSFNGF